jgi:hypothetical protein
MIAFLYRHYADSPERTGAELRPGRLHPLVALPPSNKGHYKLLTFKHLPSRIGRFRFRYGTLIRMQIQKTAKTPLDPGSSWIALRIGANDEILRMTSPDYHDGQHKHSRPFLRQEDEEMWSEAWLQVVDFVGANTMQRVILCQLCEFQHRFDGGWYSRKTLRTIGQLRETQSD